MRISSITNLAGAGLVALSLVACGAEPAEAAEAADTGSRIDRLAGFAWGATREQIVAGRGTPFVEEEDFEGVATLGYEDTLMGQPVTLLYFVHPEQGLFRGGYGVQLTSVAQCEQVLAMWESGLARRYPAIEPVRRGNAGTGRCEAYAAGGPGFMETWRDPASGARVMLTLLPGKFAVLMNYSTTAADEWERRKVASQL